MTIQFKGFGLGGQVGGGGGGSGTTVTALSISSANILTLTDSDGGTVTVDLSRLAGAGSFAVLRGVQASAFNDRFDAVNPGDTIYFVRSGSPTIEAVVSFLARRPQGSVGTRVDIWLEDVDLSGIQSSGATFLRTDADDSSTAFGAYVNYQNDVDDVDGLADFTIDNEVNVDAEIFAELERLEREKTVKPIQVHEFSWSDSTNSMTHSDTRYTDAEYLKFEGWAGPSNAQKFYHSTSVRRAEIDATGTATRIGFPRSPSGSMRADIAVTLTAAGLLTLNPQTTQSDSGEMRVWVQETP